MSSDWHSVRAEFPSLRGRTYLNTATFGLLPERAVEACARHFERRTETAATDFLTWFDEIDVLRASVARLIHADAADIAFVPNASMALALALTSVSWRAGDEILTLKDEFPNQIYAAQSIPGVRGIECEWSEFEAHVTNSTRLVVLSTVNYATGFRPNLTAMVGRLRQRGIVVYLDGTQSLGALRFDCASTQPDFLAVDAYKWMISPNGAGFVYVHPERRRQLKPNVIGWRSDKNWRNVNSLHHAAPRFSDDAEKYEGGQPPFPSLYAMQASVELMQELGPEPIERRVLQLATILRSELEQMGADFCAFDGDCLPSQIVTARLPGLDAPALAAKLAEQRIVVSARKGYLRVSPHFYNDEDDLGVLLEACRAHLRS